MNIYIYIYIDIFIWAAIYGPLNGALLLLVPGARVGRQIIDLESDGEAQRYVYPDFVTDGAMIVDGQTGKILGHGYTVTKDLNLGSQKGCNAILYLPTKGWRPTPQQSRYEA